MKGSRLVLKIAVTTLLVLLHVEAAAEPLLYVSSGARIKNKYPFAGGVSCCNCKVKHWGNLPDDFPTGKVEAVSFYLLTSRESSYYKKVREGPTTLTLMLADRRASAVSAVKPDFETYPVKHKWLLKFVFEPPVEVRPGAKWELLDGDGNMYSAVMLHSSDDGSGGGLPGIDEQTGCQYDHFIRAQYSVKFDLAEADRSIQPVPIVGPPHVGQRLRTKVLKTAVVEFTERGDLGVRDAGAIVAEWMTTALNKTRVFEVYERLSINKLMEEHKLGMSGLMEEETIAQIGKMRGVEAIVTGSVIKFGDVISVTAKLIDTETAKIIDSGDIKVTNINSISFEIAKLALELAMQ
ncbi:MAG: hypothetical protein JW950_04915 [Deltaproteobacteria bacterium]|nr:hypothetical protein [Deltaproteobacteria bacterium]